MLNPDFQPWDTSGLSLDAVFAALFDLPREKRHGRILEIKPWETRSRVVNDPRYFELDPESWAEWDSLD